MSIDDPYVAWCLDEAIATVIAFLKSGKKPRPQQKAKSNRDLIEQIKREQDILGFKIVQETSEAAP